MTNAVAKRVACPVHTTIELRDIEAKVLDSPVFQRMRHVRTLGLVYYVFPGGDFSRLSHSLGVLHVASQILTTLKRGNPRIIDQAVETDLRLAALLHDVGHAPFSHTMEHALEHYAERSVPVEDVTDGSAQAKVKAKPSIEPFDHEEVGALILQLDPVLSKVLSPEQAKNIGRIIQGDKLEVLGYPTPQRNLGRLVTSDLDADRIDYLMRTRLHTGLPYGGVDLPYLLSQIKLDDQNRICFRERALPAVDHCLLGRYFDRVTTAFHKTVAGFELLLEQVIGDLIDADLLHVDRASIEASIERGTWSDFDDGKVFELMRQLRDRKKTTGQVRERVSAVLNRKPLNLVAQLEFVGSEDNRKDFQAQRKAVQDAVQELREGSGEDWYLWEQDGFTVSSLATGEREQQASEDIVEAEEHPKEVLILPAAQSSARYVNLMPSSLLRALGDQKYFAIRVYRLSSSGTGPSAKSKKRLAKGFTDDRWQVMQ